MGMIIYFYREKIYKNKVIIVALSILGGVYIWMCNYYGYVPPIFSKWTVTSLPTVFWAFGLVILGFKYLNIENNNILIRILSLIGKASFHIFLTQMVYFCFGLGKFNLIINLLACLIGGVIFYNFETKVLKVFKIF